MSLTSGVTAGCLILERIGSDQAVTGSWKQLREPEIVGRKISWAAQSDACGEPRPIQGSTESFVGRLQISLFTSQIESLVAISVLDVRRTSGQELSL